MIEPNSEKPNWKFVLMVGDNFERLLEKEYEYSWQEICVFCYIFEESKFDVNLLLDFAQSNYLFEEKELFWMDSDMYTRFSESQEERVIREHVTFAPQSCH